MFSLAAALGRPSDDGPWAAFGGLALQIYYCMLHYDYVQYGLDEDDPVTTGECLGRLVGSLRKY